MGAFAASGRPRRPVLLVAIGMLVAAVVACGGSGSTATAGPSPAASPGAAATSTAASASQGGGGAVCPWLTPDDFASAGVPGAGPPSDNPDGTDSHYCVYAGASGATGGIELDVFLNPDVAAATATYVTATGEGPAGQPAAGGSFDQSSYAVDGKVAYLTVRKGTVVLALSVPASATAQTALVGLATTAMGRVSP